MPEYVLRHNRKDHGLYTLYAHYFVQRWESAEIPEYDLDTDELVYRSRTGNEIRRERFEIETPPEEVGTLVQSLELTTEPAHLSFADRPNLQPATVRGKSSRDLEGYENTILAR